LHRDLVVPHRLQLSLPYLVRVRRNRGGTRHTVQRLYWCAMERSKQVTIHVPRELRAYCNGASELVLSAPSVRALLDELERHHPTLYRGICDDTGAVRRHVNVFVNKDHMRDRNGLDTALLPGDEIIILPAVSGG
jgi:sulfur-carrier protein